MIRKLMAVLALLVLTAVLYYSYTHFVNSRQQSTEAINAIPADAAVIVEVEKAGEVWKQLSGSSIIWEELKITDLYFRLNEYALFLDSLMQREKKLKDFFKDRPLTISAHMSGTRDYNYLMVMELPKKAGEDEVDEAFKRIAGNTSVYREKTYDGNLLKAISVPHLGKEFAYTINKGLLIGSFSMILVEDAVRQMNSGSSLNGDTAFTTLRAAARNSSLPKVYVQFKNLNRIIETYVSDKNKQNEILRADFAEWAALDIRIKSNTLQLNGFMYSGGLDAHFLNAFKEQEEVPVNIASVLPASTAYFLFHGFSDFQKFRSDYTANLEKNNKLYSFTREINELESQCDCDIRDLALSWIGSEVAAFITEPQDRDYSQNQFVLFSSNDAGAAMEKLLALEMAVNTRKDLSKEEIEYRGHKIGHLQLGNLYERLLNKTFAQISDPYFVSLGNYIILANSKNALRTLINDYMAGNTLDRDKNYQEYAENLTSEANLMLFSSLSRSPYLYANNLNKESAANIETHTGLLRKFEAFTLQISTHKNDLYTCNIFFKHNPVYKKETNTLWELQLKSPVSSKPYLVRNHISGANEIFVQDDSNRVYLISNTGKVLFEKQLEGPILGKVQQIDVYRNNKLQLIFNTAHKLYVIDRNGNDVERFPISFKEAASNAVALFDYDNNRDYRLLISTEDGEILNFDAKGNPVDGWKIKTTKGTIIRPLQHLRVKTKDYLFAADSDGNIYLLDRQGKIRHRVKAKIEAPLNVPFGFDLGEDIESSALIYADTLGNVIRQQFDGNREEIAFKERELKYFYYRDMNADGLADYVLTAGKTISIFNQNEQQLFKLNFENEIASAPQIFVFPGGEIRIGITDKISEQLFLFDLDEKLYSGFPLYGSSPFTIGDMNKDGTLNLVTGSKDGYLYAYSLE